MSLLTRIKVWTTVVIVMAGFGAWQVATGNITSDDDNYVLSSKWSPEVLATQLPALITVTVDGHPIINRTRHLSPFHESMTASKGAVIVLRVTSANPRVHFMDCIIMRNNRSVGSGGFDSRETPGTVECVA